MVRLILTRAGWTDAQPLPSNSTVWVNASVLEDAKIAEARARRVALTVFTEPIADLEQALETVHEHHPHAKISVERSRARRIDLSPADVFALSQRQVLIVHLGSFDWDLTPGIEVRLRAGAHTLDARQIGCGGHGAKPASMLVPMSWPAAEAALKAFAGFPSISLEKR